jgi:hypothetical protein
VDAAVISLAENEHEIFVLSLCDTNGKVLINSDLLPGEQMVLWRNSLPAGVYILVGVGSEKFFVKKIIFQ